VWEGLKDKYLTPSDKGINDDSCKLNSNSQFEEWTMTAMLVACFGIILAVASWYSNKDFEDE
jgi:hypothetical protein